MTTKISRQLPTDSRTDAISGPNTSRLEPPVDISPMTRPRWSAGTSRTPTDSAIGCMTAPAMPWSSRNAMSSPIVGANAQAADPTPNSTSAVTRTLRRPKRSATRPTTGMNTASASS